ncbi:MAG: methylmalonyl-CoA epimerase [Bacteriovoracaceae bacterium]|nr:methylmalonyl-CoA epimerase [Bacteriovoracaceae bacterium]
MLPELKDCHLDHVAIAVSSIEARIKVWQDLGFVFSPEREIVQEQGVKTAFAPIDVHGHIELLEPLNAESAIGKFIAQKGEGIHHLCFKVSDVKAKQMEMQAQGYKFIYSEPKLGAGGCLVNFIHPKSTGGVLIEISSGRDHA